MHSLGRETLERLYALIAAPCAPAKWQPPTDIYRFASGWLLKCELAGVRKEEVQVAVQGRTVTISGTRRDWSVAERREAHAIEISYSHFERIVQLPEDIGDPRIETEYRDGMLLVYLRSGE